MTYENYIRPPAAPKEYAALDRILTERNERSLRQLMVTEADLTQLLAARVTARHSAKFATGSFPLVVYASGQNESWQHANFVLAEFLASHGFVVAAIPQLGTSSLRLGLSRDAIDVETQARDVEFTIAEMAQLPGVDGSEVVLIGHSLGGIVATIVALRNGEVDGVIGLDAAYGNAAHVRALTTSPYYRPEKMRAPIIDLRRPTDGLNLEPIVSFRYVDRYLYELPGMFHGDFTSFPMIAVAYATRIEGRTPEDGARGYQEVCRRVLNGAEFLTRRDMGAERLLREAPNSDRLGLRIRVLEALQPPPTEEQFVQMIRVEGVEKARKVLLEAKAREPGAQIVSSRIMTALAYDFLDQGDPAMGAQVIDLALEMYPGSADLYDSLGDLREQAGDDEGARAAYSRVLELIAADLALDKDAREILRNRATRKVRALSDGSGVPQM